MAEGYVNQLSTEGVIHKTAVAKLLYDVCASLNEEEFNDFKYFLRSVDKLTKSEAEETKLRTNLCLHLTERIPDELEKLKLVKHLLENMKRHDLVREIEDFLRNNYDAETIPKTLEGEDQEFIPFLGPRVMANESFTEPIPLVLSGLPPAEVRLPKESINTSENLPLWEQILQNIGENIPSSTYETSSEPVAGPENTESHEEASPGAVLPEPVESLNAVTEYQPPLNTSEKPAGRPLLGRKLDTDSSSKSKSIVADCPLPKMDFDIPKTEKAKHLCISTDVNPCNIDIDPATLADGTIGYLATEKSCDQVATSTKSAAQNDVIAMVAKACESPASAAVCDNEKTSCLATRNTIMSKGDTAKETSCISQPVAPPSGGDWRADRNALYQEFQPQRFAVTSTWWNDPSVVQRLLSYHDRYAKWSEEDFNWALALETGFLEEFTDLLKESSSLPIVTFECSGCIFEETNIEGDAGLTVHILITADDLDMIPTPKPGYRVFQAEGTSFVQFCRDGKISPGLVEVEFYAAVDRTVSKINQFHLSVRKSSTDGAVQLLMNEGYEKRMINLIPTLLNQGTHYIPQSAHGIPLSWKRCTAVEEKQKELPAEAKMIIRILKALRQKNAPLKKLETAHFKAAVHHMENRGTCWDFENLGIRFIDVVQYLSEALTKRKLSHPMIMQMNMLDGLSDVVCDNMAGWLKALYNKQATLFSRIEQPGI